MTLQGVIQETLCVNTGDSTDKFLHMTKMKLCPAGLLLVAIKYGPILNAKAHQKLDNRTKEAPAATAPPVVAESTNLNTGYVGVIASI